MCIILNGDVIGPFLTGNTIRKSGKLAGLEGYPITNFAAGCTNHNILSAYKHMQ